jgi:hypothetical protein
MYGDPTSEEEREYLAQVAAGQQNITQQSQSKPKARKSRKKPKRGLMYEKAAGGKDYDYVQI